MQLTFSFKQTKAVVLAWCRRWFWVVIILAVAVFSIAVGLYLRGQRPFINKTGSVVKTLSDKADLPPIPDKREQEPFPLDLSVPTSDAKPQ